MPTYSVYAAEVKRLQEGEKIKLPYQQEPVEVSSSIKGNYPKGKKPTVSNIEAATDAKKVGQVSDIKGTQTTKLTPLQQRAQAMSLNKNSDNKVTSPSIDDAPKKITPRELTDKRDATSTVFQNADGSLTEKNYFTPQFYKKDNKWEKINTTLSEDKNAGDAGNFLTKAYGQVESWFSSTNDYVVTENDWQARFSPSGSDKGMVRIKKDNDQIGFLPINANKVDPVVATNKNGKQTVRYPELWSGVDVEYVVETYGVKENVILKNKNAKNSVSFKVLGANLKKNKSNEQGEVDYSIEGALGNTFKIAPANLILNNFGFVSDTSVFSQEYKDGTIVLSVKQSYLDTLPAKAFPAVIDPAVFQSTFGTRAGGNYMSFKTDGYICSSAVCNVYAGSLYDSGGALRWWRGAFHAPYDQFRNSSNALLNATLHLTQRSNESFWTGTWDTHTYYAGHATCLNNFNCIDGAWGSATFSSVGDINLTGLYQSRIAANDFGAWIMVDGNDGTASSYKNFDPAYSYVTFTYGGPPSSPAIATPTNNQVFVDPQPTFSVNTMSNPNGATPLKYEMRVSSGVNGYGALVYSGLLPGQSWTVPDGILQDGMTYYLQARSYDPITGLASSFGDSVAFRIDMRTGSGDPTQTYENFGMVGVSMATGQMSTSNNSHTTKALGGDIGASLNYSAPLKSRPGLIGEYYNFMEDATTPVLTRVDQAVDFNLGAGSPGAPVYSDNFLVGWNGYFIVPVTGTYQFGLKHNAMMEIYLNNQHQTLAGSCAAKCYNSPMTLTAGDVVPIQINYLEMSTVSNSEMYLYVKGAVAEQVVPKTWLQTGVRPVTDRGQGLTGSYYGRFDGTNTFSTGNPLLMKRNDPYINFDWGLTSPMPNGPDGYLVRWTGYVTVPAAGNYTFGSKSDDGTKIMLGASNTVVYNDWTLHGATEGFGSTYALAANIPTKITVEYFNVGGAGSFQLLVQGAVAKQVVPSAWLSPNANVLPVGWSLGLDPEGNATYDRLTVNQSSVILSDSNGATHEYKWNGSAYVPPVNEDGDLLRNADGTYTMQDVDGRTYIFAVDGTLISLTSATDDRKPVALQYEYQNTSNGPTRLYKIKDGVDATRNATFYYSGDSNCSSAPSGFDGSAPSGMLCAIVTNDGRKTNLFYTSGQLARVNRPGNDNTDYIYQAIAHSTDIAGYLLTGIRSSLINDGIAAGMMYDDPVQTTEIAYDYAGRVSSVTQPEPDFSAPRLKSTIEYLPGTSSYVDSNGVVVPGFAGITKKHIIGAVEPNGFSRTVKFDSLFRTVEDIDATNKVHKTEWDQNKDLIYSTTDIQGLKSTTIYDDDDRATDNYGAAPSAWYGSDRKPLTSPTNYTNQIPHTQTSYDQNIAGPGVAWFDYKKQTGNTAGALVGAPKIHKTGINTTPGTLSYDFTSPPITAGTGAQGIGFSATGKLRLPVGTYTFSAATPDGVKLWIGDQLVINQWTDSTTSRNTSSASFSITDTSPKRFRLDVYRKTGTTGSFSLTVQQQGGFTATTNWGTYLSAGYNLVTSEKEFDAVLGDVTTTSDYGVNPELGLVQGTTTNPSSANLTTSATYETQGGSTSFLRQTAKTLPGSTVTNYSYYGATETRDDPCTTDATEAYKQGGMLKIKSDPDPDGTGAQTRKTAESIYNNAGQVVASRYNQEPWTCLTYDERGRLTQTLVAHPTLPSRLIFTNYSVSGNPLFTGKGDTQVGYNLQKTDFLGRPTRSFDIFNNLTVNTYNALGLTTSKESVKGLEEFTYDSFNRLTSQSLDGEVLATLTYDQYSAIQQVEYPSAKPTGSSTNLKLSTVKKDALQRNNGVTYTFSNGQLFDENLTLSQKGFATAYTDTYDGKTAGATYVYDTADRLIESTVDKLKYQYSFGNQNSACTSMPGYNANARKNGNRTQYTITNLQTSVSTASYYCYDKADRLIGSNDTQIGTPTYDSRGNILTLNGGGQQITFTYDQFDQNTSISQGANMVQYMKDANGSVIVKREFTNGNVSKVYRNLEGVLMSCDPQNENNCSTLDKYVSLPGNVLFTVKANETSKAIRDTYSLKNFHDDTAITADGTGLPKGSINLYEPFGRNSASFTFGTGLGPDNSSNEKMGWASHPDRKIESKFTLPVIQMGARTYLPTLGRFAQVDPVEGGTENNYAYVNDPINNQDYSGQCPWCAAILLVVAKQALAQGGKQVVKQAPAQAAKKAAPKVAPQAALKQSGKVPNTLNDMRIHGNSLQSQKPTWGYKVYSSDGSILLKNGITSQVNPLKRYPNSFYQDGRVMQPIQQFPNRLDAYTWEYQQNVIQRGLLNRNMH